jgi:hypothetical protein
MRRLAALALVATLVPFDSEAVPFWGAKESRPPETAPADLKQGEFVWNPGAAEIGPILVLVSLGEQRAYVYRNGVQIGYTTVSSGREGYGTPTGVFHILQRDRNHHSNKYNNAPMPFQQRLTWDGVALHAGGLPGYPSSHGCVHLPSKFAEDLFEVSHMGMTVVVVDEHSAPTQVAHPPAFSPVDPATGQPVVAGSLQDSQDFRLEPEKATFGPVSILVSSADQRALVLRNGVEIGRARISVRDPQLPLGTHTFVMRDAQGLADITWVAVSMPGHFDEAGRAMSHEAAQRVDVPPGFARAIGSLLTPGDTLFVTDAPILAENMRSDFTVLSNGSGEPIPD